MSRRMVTRTFANNGPASRPAPAWEIAGEAMPEPDHDVRFVREAYAEARQAVHQI